MIKDYRILLGLSLIGFVIFAMSMKKGFTQEFVGHQ